ncbi:hypothetical protein P9381_15820, partial [Geobacillus stearothermophilus]|nr:hypothetical protein [Geobacillus stearothermophilus]
FKEKLGLKPSEQAGRKISDATYEKLKAAKEVIDELLRIAEEERANKSKEGDDEVKVEDGAHCGANDPFFPSHAFGPPFALIRFSIADFGEIGKQNGKKGTENRKEDRR